MRNLIRSPALLATAVLIAIAPVADAQDIPVRKDYTVSQTPSNTDVAMNETPSRIVEFSSGDLALYQGATDANIIAHVLTGDSIQIAMANLAFARSSNATVRGFAQTMVDGHTQNATYFRQMQSDESIGITPMVNDPIAAMDRAALAELDDLTGAAFDRAYIRAQVAHHDADAAALTWMAENSQDDDIEEDFEAKLIPAVKQHLTQVRTIAGQLGVDVSAYRVTP